MREIKLKANIKGTTEVFRVCCIDFVNEDVTLIVDEDRANQEVYKLMHLNIIQCTGEKDKTGKEIYEGDIVDLDSWGGVQQICFIEGAFCLADDKAEYVGDIHYIHHAEIEQAKIIGNIYENPGLLKSEAT